MPESWTKLYTIDIGERFRRVVGFLKSGDVIVATRESWGDLLLYEPISQRTLKLYLYGLSESFYLDKENVYQHRLNRRMFTSTKRCWLRAGKKNKKCFSEKVKNILK